MRRSCRTPASVGGLAAPIQILARSALPPATKTFNENRAAPP